jgi:ADP-ribosylglycohydrolase
MLTDDTQLTLATCETLSNGHFDPDKLAKTFLKYYKERRIVGMGSSTLKAMQDLDAGISWLQSGRSGEFAAVNGAAMRIAPFAFFPSVSRDDIFNACKITHRNDEAYTGALAVYLSVKCILNKQWDGHNNLIELLIPQLPDTRVRDRLIEINNLKESESITGISRLGNNGYVVNSIPFAIFSATQVLKLGMRAMFEEIIDTGGDTDTNCSVAGQISGTLLGSKQIPRDLTDELKILSDYVWMKNIIDKAKEQID